MHGIFEFPHIPFPGIALDFLHCSFADRAEFKAVHFRVFFHEMAGEGYDIRRPLAELVTDRGAGHALTRRDDLRL